MSGVGTQLSSLIPDWAVSDKKGCKCRSYAEKMDRQGIDWCESNLDGIVQHLLGQMEYLLPAFRILPASAIRVAASRLVKLAIKKAREA